VARNRGISTEEIRYTQAAMLFGHDAINAGLADGFHTLDELLAAPKTTEPIFLTTNQRRPKMETEKIETQSLEEQALEAYLKDPPDKPDEDDTPEFTTRINELVKLCKIAKRPELLAGWIERGVTVVQAQELLLQEMEANDADIISARTTAKPPENPLIQAAKNRLTH
jgi:ClpP class serine protease